MPRANKATKSKHAKLNPQGFRWQEKKKVMKSNPDQTWVPVYRKECADKRLAAIAEKNKETATK